VVIDDPESILKCNNKVYLAEFLGRHHLPAPRTLIVHKGNVGEIIPALGLPCVLKQPDSSFSMGVVKAETEAELYARVSALLDKSELVIAQEWLPTCRVPDDCIDPKRRALFVSRAVMRGLIDQLRSEAT